LALERTRFEQQVIARLRQAIEDDRLSQQQVVALGVDLESIASQQIAA